jgi:hypothetical protein
VIEQICQKWVLFCMDAAKAEIRGPHPAPNPAKWNIDVATTIHYNPKGRPLLL